MTATLEKPVRRFRVLRGIHSEGGKVYGKGRPDGDVVETTNDLMKHNGDGQPHEWKFMDITFGTPESMPSKVDSLTKDNKRLRELLKAAGLSEEEIDGEVAQQSPNTPSGVQAGPNSDDTPEATLEKLLSMTVAQLREYAEDNEISLGGATRKDDIVTAIQEALG